MIASIWVNEWILLWVSASCHFFTDAGNSRLGLITYCRSLLSFLNLLPVYLANLFYKRGAIPGLFSFIFVYSVFWLHKWQIKFCRWRDLNRGSLVSDVTALPTEPPPLSTLLIFLKDCGNTIALVFIHWMRDWLCDKFLFTLLTSYLINLFNPLSDNNQIIMTNATKRLITRCAREWRLPSWRNLEKNYSVSRKKRLFLEGDMKL